jgi:2-epi-5-epi-valiolone synthase
MLSKRVSQPASKPVRVFSHRNADSAGVEQRDIPEGIETRFDLTATREIRYSVIHPAGYVLDRRNSVLQRAAGSRPVLAVVDQQVNHLYGDDLRAYLENELDLRGYLTIDGSESSKTWMPVQRICEKAIDVELSRDGVMMAVGGGVTLDITGFAASIFRRGVNVVRIPTSLIGLIDVGVGIKHSINLGNKKSILGSFYPAIVNINDPTFLATLPPRHISCGIAEIIKVAMVLDANLFATLETHLEEFLAQRFQVSPLARDVLVRSEVLMMQQIEPNLFESDLQRLPDFGHTFSPTIEAVSGWTIQHGEAVAMDMLISTALAQCKGLCSPITLERLRKLLSLAGLPFTPEVCRPDVLMKALRAARQHRAGNLNLVVPLEIGQADFIQEVCFDEIEQALALIDGGDLTNVGALSRPWRDASAPWNMA